MLLEITLIFLVLVWLFESYLDLRQRKKYSSKSVLNKFYVCSLVFSFRFVAVFGNLTRKQRELNTEVITNDKTAEGIAMRNEELEFRSSSLFKFVVSFPLICLAGVGSPISWMRPRFIALLAGCEAILSFLDDVLVRSTVSLRSPSFCNPPFSSRCFSFHVCLNLVSFFSYLLFQRWWLRVLFWNLNLMDSTNLLFISSLRQYPCLKILWNYGFAFFLSSGLFRGQCANSLFAILTLHTRWGDYTPEGKEKKGLVTTKKGCFYSSFLLAVGGLRERCFTVFFPFLLFCFVTLTHSSLCSFLCSFSFPLLALCVCSLFCLFFSLQLTQSFVFLALFVLHDFLFNAPFEIYRFFVIEEKHGFNKMTLRLWVMDQVG